MISKNQSRMLQGVAILLMMYHHFYLNPAPMGVSFFNVEVAVKVAWFGKICVGIFAFVSGYGAYVALGKIDKSNFCKCLKNEYKEVLIRLLRLLFKFWFVLCINKILDYIILEEEINISEFWKNFFLVETTYNGSWWYMQQYLQMMLLAPLVDMSLTNFKYKERRIKRIFYIFVLGVTIVALSVMYVNSREMLIELFHALRPTFTLIFLIGYIFARFSLFQKINIERLSEKVRLLIGCLLVITTVAIRILITKDPSESSIDFILIPFLVLGLVLVTEFFKKLQDALAFIGTYSTFMWLIHLIVSGYTKDLIVPYISNSLAYYLIQVGLCLLISMLLTYISNKKALIL